MSLKVMPSILASVSGSDGLYISKSERILSAIGTNTWALNCDLLVMSC